MIPVAHAGIVAVLGLLAMAVAHAAGTPNRAAATARDAAQLRAISLTRQGALNLPPPTFNGTHSLPQLLQQRRSQREFAPTPLALAQVGQLLWAAQGITAAGKFRTAPSSGALYPLELYVVAGAVAGLPAGIYHYQPHGHRLLPIRSGDRRHALAAAAFRQTWIATAPAIIVFGAVPARTAAKYGGRANRYVHIEAGHAAQNLFLQAGDLGLGAAEVGAFDDREIARILQLPRDAMPLLLMPVGAPRR